MSLRFFFQVHFNTSPMGPRWQALCSLELQYEGGCARKKGTKKQVEKKIQYPIMDQAFLQLRSESIRSQIGNVTLLGKSGMIMGKNLLIWWRDMSTIGGLWARNEWKTGKCPKISKFVEVHLMLSLKINIFQANFHFPGHPIHFRAVSGPIFNS